MGIMTDAVDVPLTRSEAQPSCNVYETKAMGHKQPFTLLYSKNPRNVKNGLTLPRVIKTCSRTKGEMVCTST